MLFEAVAYLHQTGYQKIRLMSYLAPSGCYFRVVISLKKNFDKKTGFVLCREGEDDVYWYSTGGKYMFFYDADSMEDASAEELAAKLLSACPALEKEGKGEDEAYAAWFSKMLEMTEGEGFPYAFADHGYDIYEEGKILFTNDKGSIAYAPPGECEGTARYR